jgi:phosphate transport system substrate-binding protein
MAGETRRCEEMLYAGDADLALVLRLPGEGAAPAPPVRETAVAVDGLAVIVHPSRALYDISSSALSALYAGRLADWTLLGEAAETTQPLSLPEGAFARDLLTSKTLGGGALTTAALLLPHDRAMVAYVATHPGAIGYSSRAATGEGVKAISLDGLLPSPDNLARGAYPLAYEIALLSRDDASPEANRLAAFLRGRKGQALVTERYALPR